MNEPTPSLHVHQIGQNWEVESEGGTLGQAETKPEAEEMATTLAKEMRTDRITFHTSDGRVEKEIAVELPPASAHNPSQGSATGLAAES